jgi:hypothetical protein
MFERMFATVLEFAERQAVLPRGIEEMPPGPELAVLLDAIDVDRLSAADRVTVMEAEQRLVSHFQARVYASMAALVDRYDADPGDAYEGAAMEIAPALRLTRRAVDIELGLAARLAELPGVAALLRDGRIDRRRAATLVRGTEHLPPDRAAEVIGGIVDDLPGLTSGQIVARLRKQCMDADPSDAKRRYDEAVEERRVVTEMGPDGAVSILAFDLPAERAAAAAHNVDRIALDLRRSGDARTIDQLRADVLVDLLLAVDPSRVSRDRGVVEITASLETLMGLRDDSGDLAGYGPVIADVARRVADQQRDAEWRFRITDGCIDHTGITRRRPTAEQARRVEVRDRRCVFPGCRMPARYADIDHIVPHAEHGATCPCNLAVLCRWHHVRRHRFGWTYRRLESGDYRWTSPLGHTSIADARSP